MTNIYKIRNNIILKNNKIITHFHKKIKYGVLYIHQELNILEKLKMIKEMGSEPFSILMEVNIMEIGLIIK